MFKWNCFVFYAYYSHVVLHMIVWCLVFDSTVKDLIENWEIDLVYYIVIFLVLRCWQTCLYTKTWIKLILVHVYVFNFLCQHLWGCFSTKTVHKVNQFLKLKIWLFRAESKADTHIIIMIINLTNMDSFVKYSTDGIFYPAKIIHSDNMLMKVKFTLDEV